jgi:glycosyltransferase involved in cell wall biosynthesis
MPRSGGIVRYLFVHQNFPGQYKHLAAHMAAGGHEVAFITQRRDRQIPGVRNVVYKPARDATKGVHHYIADFERAVITGQGAFRAAQALKAAGFKPDIVLGNPAWGEMLFLKEVFPEAPMLGLFEFFYRFRGQDVGFDPESPVTLNDAPRVRAKNSTLLISLDACDAGVCPTRWQHSTFPRRYREMLSVVHEGIDTERLVPDPAAELVIAEKNLRLTREDEVVTYITRNLEPYRGFHVFMRALPEILRRRPGAQVLIVGGDNVSYSKRLPPGETYREKMLAELGDSIDRSRVHFAGYLPYEQYMAAVRVSSVHVYLTYPFVLSWSMLEAMSMGALVIGSRTPPVEEVIADGDNGLLVDFFSTAGIAERVEEALSDPGRMSAIRARARQTVVERYDLRSRCLPEQLALVERTVGAPAPACV